MKKGRIIFPKFNYFRCRYERKPCNIDWKILNYQRIKEFEKNLFHKMKFE